MLKIEINNLTRDEQNALLLRLEKLESVCQGLSDEVIDGGFTVAGLQAYTKRLEEELKACMKTKQKMVRRDLGLH